MDNSFDPWSPCRGTGTRDSLGRREWARQRQILAQGSHGGTAMVGTLSLPLPEPQISCQAVCSPVPPPARCAGAGPHNVCTEMGFFRYSGFVINGHTSALCHLLCPQARPGRGGGPVPPPTWRPGLPGLPPQTGRPAEVRERTWVGPWVSKVGPRPLANLPLRPVTSPSCPLFSP